MDIDALLIGTLLETQDARNLRLIRREFLDGEWKTIYDYILDFFRKHRRLPRPETISGRFSREVTPGVEPFTFYADETLRRAMTNALSNGLREHVFKHIEDRNPEAAFDGMKKILAGVSRQFYHRSETGAITLRENVKERTEAYKERKLKKGILGIETPWESLTRATGGWQDGDVIVFTARPEIGKTWFALICAIHAVLKGYRVLFTSMEMRPMKISVRADALAAGISSDRFRRGVLTAKEEAQLKKWYKRCLSQEKTLGELIMYGSNDIRTVLDLEIKILEDRPDLVIWDSFYLSAETMDWKDIAQVVRDCKLLAEREDIFIPIALITQLRRSVRKADKRAETGDVAFTQAISNDADIILSLFRTLDMENLLEMLMRSVKIRDGIKLRELLIRWDLDNMDFHELSASFTGKGDSSFDNPNVLKKKGKK